MSRWKFNVQYYARLHSLSQFKPGKLTSSYFNNRFMNSVIISLKHNLLLMTNDSKLFVA